jgi:hypothetical protein
MPSATWACTRTSLAGSRVPLTRLRESLHRSLLEAVVFALLPAFPPVAARKAGLWQRSQSSTAAPGEPSLPRSPSAKHSAMRRAVDLGHDPGTSVRVLASAAPFSPTGCRPGYKRLTRDAGRVGDRITSQGRE